MYRGPAVAVAQATSLRPAEKELLLRLQRQFEVTGRDDLVDAFGSLLGEPVAA